jgi:Flp pilus assembly pilin Flp
MNQLLKDFLADESGQDLIEYSLLMAFVALASAVVFQGAGKTVAGIWTTANSRLVQANTQGS